MAFKYDYICSIGSSCLCAIVLREARLRLASGPFDWVTDGSFGSRIDFLVNDFAGWFEARDLEKVGNPNKFDHDSYRNLATGFLFPHEFEPGRPFDEEYASIRAKYDRRISRMYRSIGAADRVLFVWIENPVDTDRPSEEDVVAARKRLMEKFPGTAVDFLVIDRAGDDAATGEMVRGDGWYRVSCGYRRKAQEDGAVRPWDVELGPILSVLSQFSVADNRSAAERNRYSEAKRRAQYTLLGVDGPVGAFVVKMQIKICKLLMNRLRRRGVPLRRVFETQLETYDEMMRAQVKVRQQWADQAGEAPQA